MFTLNRTHIPSLLNFTSHSPPLLSLTLSLTDSLNTAEPIDRHHHHNIETQLQNYEEERNFLKKKESHMRAKNIQLKAHISLTHVSLLFFRSHSSSELCPHRLNPKARLKIYIHNSMHTFRFFRIFFLLLLILSYYTEKSFEKRKKIPFLSDQNLLFFTYIFLTAHSSKLISQMQCKRKNVS